MSAVAEPVTEHRVLCEHCGTPLAEDQEWCLRCGAARTLIHRPPDWRIAAAIVGAVALLVLAGFAIALINLSSDANRSAIPMTTSAARTTAPRAATTSARAAASIAGWATGLPGWTVVLVSSPDHATALAGAQRLGAAGLHVGMLDTSRHPSTNMKPRRWVVFTGRYPTRAAARAHAAALTARGHRAWARLVGLPGR